MPPKPSPTYYVVTYRDPSDGNVTELSADKVQDSELGLSFIAISGFRFPASSLVVDPSAEALKRRFEGVRTLHLSLYSVLSVREVGVGPGRLRFKAAKSNLVLLPAHAGPKP